MKAALILAGGVLVLFVGLWLWARAYLHGPEFQRFVAARLGETLRAEVEIMPLQFDGLSVSCDGVKARGYEGAAFSGAQMEQVRARFSLRRIFNRAWLIEQLDAGRVEVKLDGTRLAAPDSASGDHPPSTIHSPSWLPNRLEVGGASVRELAITWAGGALQGVAVQAAPGAGGWDLEGRGGELLAAGLPPLDVSTLRLRQRGTMLFINEAIFAARHGGRVAATGEVDFSRALDVQAKIEGMDLGPFLSGDWRLRLHGRMNGDIRVQSALPAAGPPVVSGALRFTDARIEALPVLEQIAAFTRMQQLRQLPLTRASCEFRSEPGRIEVAKLVAESEARLRIEGGFVIADGRIEGTLQVGVPPSSLAWLPGSRERVFTVARDGYVWTPVRLSGPAGAPTEDLSARLATAAAGAVVEKVEGAAQDVIQRGKDAAKGALDLLIPLLK